MIELQEHENVLRIIRRFWLSLLPELAIATFFCLLPTTLWWTPWLLLVSNLTLNTPLLNLLFFTYYLFLALAILVSWMDYSLDFMLVTDQRIMVVEQKGFFRRQVTTIPKDRIQDITVRKEGVLQSFFDFGEIQLQTAGEENFLMKDVFRPNDAKNYILRELHVPPGFDPR